jgi:hypothetical protein
MTRGGITKLCAGESSKAADPLRYAILEGMDMRDSRVHNYPEGKVAEAKRERLVNLVAEPDLGPLSRTLLRLRHDLVIIGRAAVAPLPDNLAQRLGPTLTRLGTNASVFLHRLR